MAVLEETKAHEVQWLDTRGAHYRTHSNQYEYIQRVAVGLMSLCKLGYIFKLMTGRRKYFHL